MVNQSKESKATHVSDNVSDNVSDKVSEKAAGHNYSLLAPGPVNLHPGVREILAQPMIHHRTPEFDAILSRVLKGLKEVFVTEQPVYIHASTGSGGMESLLVNCLSPQSKVLAIVSGKFGERWAQMAETFGMDVQTLSVAWGQAVDPQLVRVHLTKHPDTAAVLCQACETSTAVGHPIAELGKIVSEFEETLFMVDGITAVGAYPLPMDEYRIDALVAGSQKAFMLPTGLAFVSFSKKAEAFFSSATCPRYYFDIRREAKANKAGETFFSAPVPLIKALDFVLAETHKTGLTSLHATVARRANIVRKFLPNLGFKIYSESPCSSVSAFSVPEGIDGQNLRAHLEKNYNITIMGGQDQLKGKIIRVGHMGYIQDSEWIQLVDGLGKSLQSLKPGILTQESLDNILKIMAKELDEST